jgi:hypothetical protein
VRDPTDVVCSFCLPQSTYEADKALSGDFALDMKTYLHCLTVVSLLLAPLTGCQTPDLKPFADSTANLHQAVVRSQDIVRSEFHELRTSNVLTNEDELINAERTFTNAFAQRIAFMEAVVNYSDSLAAVADAGKNGQANAQALGDSVKTLAEAAGSYGAAVGVAADVFAKIFGVAAQAWAVHSLKEATAKADPFIAYAAEIMQKDMNNIVDILATSQVPLVVAMQKPYRADIARRNSLLRFREAQSLQINEYLTKTNWPDLLTDYNKKIAEVNTILDAADKWYLPLNEKMGELQVRLDGESQLMRQTAAGFKQWERAHADLVQALKDNRQPNIRMLLSTVLEIKSEIETLKKH